MFKRIMKEILKFKAYVAVAAYKRRIRAKNELWLMTHFR